MIEIRSILYNLSINIIFFSVIYIYIYYIMHACTCVLYAHVKERRTDVISDVINGHIMYWSIQFIFHSPACMHACIFIYHDLEHATVTTLNLCLAIQV